ncbi:hypothetical protein [Segetibacter sp. 3557_3]|uniref:hypothetical protein n=1 Tax=Segetibacter sp. 3557_3 TaxID=2547429 RepID=UPI001404B8F6|nr:hypothetical protein [Segetibacter sp. 3557_3]
MLKNILLLDDDSDDAELFCEALQDVAPETNCVVYKDCTKALRQLGNDEIDLPEFIF